MHTETHTHQHERTHALVLRQQNSQQQENAKRGAGQQQREVQPVSQVEFAQQVSKIGKKKPRTNDKALEEEGEQENKQIHLNPCSGSARAIADSEAAFAAV